MLTLTEKEKRAIAQIIKDKQPDLADKYPLSKFPDEPYTEFKKVFATPENVQPDHIRLALEWKYGHCGGRNDVKSHQTIITIVQDQWGAFCEKKTLDANAAFRFWREQLSEHPYFIPSAFLTHLLYPNAAENMDFYHFYAMNELIQTVRPEWSPKERPVKFEDLKDYSAFAHMLNAKLDFLTNDKAREFDKLMRTFGSRNIFIPADNKTGKKNDAVELISFAWKDLQSGRFDVEKIVNRQNADKLFACLLQLLEKRSIQSDRLTIGEIARLIPRGTAGISIYASYQYAMIGLFSRQKGRRYFLFEDKPELVEAFTRQANNPSRDINFWKNYTDEIVSVNPEFVLAASKDN